MAPTNLIHFGVDPQLASLRSKLLMSFGFQMHSCSSLSELDATLKRRNIQGCLVCQTVPGKMLETVEKLLAENRIPMLVLTSEGPQLAETASIRYSSTAAREFLPKLQAMMSRR